MSEIHRYPIVLMLGDARSAVVNPDLLLRDLVKIFHPELVQEECVYYKQLK